ncbi:MAG: hypothetical protein A2486_07685 [Burkholderiales bacterium RIFOXYC12_FULL_65_23]|uniref:hypothetical protein n=1 Tax=Malikia spinosa TaxID=86180 RepID=UPI0008BC1DB3|nr:hypothetical protein [Malikia spinosa]OGB70983.1 MAG: hypothetical protein A2486_07685 [Burkholderiales bacterium RIFOXYC12_FULL_65_23]
MHSSLPTQRSGLERLRHVARPVMAVATGLMVAALATGCGGNDLLAGSLDTHFGKASDGTPDGIVSLSLGSGNDSAKAMAVQADGKVIVAGTSTSTGGSSNIVIERFNSDGTLDATFGADGNSDGTPDGVVNLDLGTSSDDAKAVAIQADGKIVVAGNSTPTGGSSNVVLARLDKNGKLDATFGADGNADGTPDGVVQVSFGNGDDAVDAIAIQQDGKIVVAGDTTSNTGNGSQNMVVARVNANGSLDATFGAGTADGTPDGVVSLSLGAGNDEAKAVAIQANGKIVIAGNTIGSDNSSNIAVARLNGDGSLDAAFGVGNADGTPDGVVAVSLSNGDDKAKAVALQADGKILVGGVTLAADNSSNVAVARLNSDGTADASFGAGTADGTPDGSVSVSFGAGDDKLKGLVVQADGKILIAGSNTAADGSTNAVVARFNSNGALDSSFGEDSSDGTPNGVVSISLGSGDDSAEALALQADGKILIAGDHVASDGSSNIFVARLIN